MDTKGMISLARAISYGHEQALWYKDYNYIQPRT